ncbi:MAG: DUF1684 domain-containing protein [Leadbetterella sp.]|nr:DUF1684 domain-containing protein [Leadbetterella sp.]
MFRNKFVLGIIIAGIAGILIYMFSSAPTYAEKALKEQEAYKTTMVSMDDSPLKNKEGITFFAPDEKWVFEADFIRAENKREFKVQMTDSTMETSHLAGYATLKVGNETYNLLVFDEGAQFLLPFRDKTNGNETYGGGRYINIEKGQLVGKKLTIDFNKSHNFYCAYDGKYVCPIPPRENVLAVAVTAGELNFKK